jgi:adenylate cyclase
VRVRRRDRRTWLTVKSGAGRVRVEEEIEIEPERFDRLWPLTEGRRIEKTRYEIPAGDDLVIELDVYTGDLAGLVTAEVEFGSEEDAEAYVAPDWLGPDITEDLRYKNQRLARDGAP